VSASSSEGRSSELEVRFLSEKRRPFGEGLLHAALAEVALAGRDQRLNLLNAAALGDRNQRDVGRIALG
jgi:hypothetical protein